MANVIYNSYKKTLLDKTIDHANDTLKVALCTASYTPDADNHDFFNDVTNEVSSSGYTAGGATLANKSTAQDNTDNEGVFDSDDPSWTGVTFTARWAILYQSTGNAATSRLICAFDLGGDVSVVGGTLTLTVPAEGWLNTTS